MKRQAVVVGGGIAGLASAYALLRLDYDVCVLERDDQLRSEGAGLTLWPNAVRALEAVGLGDVIAECAHAVSEAVTLTPAGSVITTVPLDRIAKRFGPLVSVHRADLLNALAARFGGEIRFGVDVQGVDGALQAQGTPIDADPALRAYEGDRKRRAERVVRQSRAMGWMAQASNPMIAGARDLLARRIPEAVAFRQMARVLAG